MVWRNSFPRWKFLLKDEIILMEKYYVKKEYGICFAITSSLCVFQIFMGWGNQWDKSKRPYFIVYFHMMIHILVLREFLMFIGVTNRQMGVSLTLFFVIPFYLTMVLDFIVMSIVVILFIFLLNPTWFITWYYGCE